MTTSQLALADELVVIRAEIARLKTRETALASMENNFPQVPVFRRKVLSQVAAGAESLFAAHA